MYNPRRISSSRTKEAAYEILREQRLRLRAPGPTYTRRHEGAESPYYYRVGAEYPGLLDFMLRFGPVYLTRKQYERRLAALYAHYLGYLRRRSRRLGDKEFRSFHAARLRELVSRTQAPTCRAAFSSRCGAS